MATMASDRWNWLKNRFRFLPIFIRRLHRIAGPLWLLLLAVGLVVPDAMEQLPGPSIIGISLVALIITGSYLLFRPWVRGPTTVSDRLNGLKHWTWTPTVVIRRTHRIASTLFLLFLAIGLSITATGGPESPLFIIPVVVLLIYQAITGMYMFLRPWANRFRAG